MSKIKINLACGSIYISNDEWINFDYMSSSPSVSKADLLGRLPLADDSTALVYSSHFLEHIPRSDVPAFLHECHRVLVPGGVLRLVLPDLENMVREYLAMRETGEHEKADFVVLEMVDQCVRRESGGELGRFYRQLRANPNANTDSMMDYVRERVGEDLRAAVDPKIARGVQFKLRRLFSALRGRIERYWLRLWILALPAAFRTQNVSLAGVGERHHWLWDFHQLRQALESAGFTEVQRRTANSSGIVDFPFHPLDLDADDRPRKGAESMYVEARKPD